MLDSVRDLSFGSIQHKIRVERGNGRLHLVLRPRLPQIEAASVLQSFNNSYQQSQLTS